MADRCLKIVLQCQENECMPYLAFDLCHSVYVPGPPVHLVPGMPLTLAHSEFSACFLFLKFFVDHVKSVNLPFSVFSFLSGTGVTPDRAPWSFDVPFFSASFRTVKMSQVLSS